MEEQLIASTQIFPEVPTAPPEEPDYEENLFLRPSIFDDQPASPSSRGDLPPSYSKCCANNCANSCANLNQEQVLTVSDSPPLSETQVRSIVSEYLKQNLSCIKYLWIQKSPEKMQIHGIESIPAFSHGLASYTETRSLEWVSEPYKNQQFNSHGTVPDRWSVNMDFKTPTPFSPGKASILLPNSGRVLNCKDCNGIGSKACANCNQTGVTRCRPCNGTGRMQRVEECGNRCGNCMGTGKRLCASCSSGWNACPSCHGRKSLFYQQVVHIKWENNTSVCCTTSELGLEVLGKAEGWPRCQQRSSGRVYPFSWAANVSGVGEELKDKAKCKLTALFGREDEHLRVLQVEQVICEIPIVKVNFEWEGEKGYFFVYGVDSKVHFPAQFKHLQYNSSQCTIV